MNIEIRPAVAEDAAALNRLSAQLGYLHSIDETLERIHHLQQSGNNQVLVAVSENVVTGWMHLSKATWLESGLFAEIAGLVVDEDYRGQQIGESLVAAAKAWAVAQGSAVLKVRSNVLRTRAHRFYLRTGFNETKESKVFEMKL